jgi:hypothetical protein
MKKAAGESLPPSQLLTGPADPLVRVPRPALGLRAGGGGRFIVLADPERRCLMNEHEGGPLMKTDSLNTTSFIR